MSWWERWFRRARGTNGTAKRYLAHIQSQQAEVDQMTRDIRQHRDAFTEAFTEALRANREGR